MPAPRPERYTPFTLRAGIEGCPRWLDAQLRASFQPDEPFHRWNVRYALLAQLGDAHAAGGAPAFEDIRVPARGVELLPEELWFFGHFAQVYADVFAGLPGTTVAHGCDRPNDVRGVSLGGAVDLLLELPAGSRELRQLELWGRDLANDPQASWELALAVLRLHRVAGIRGDLRVCHADLRSGVTTVASVDLAEAPSAVMAALGPQISELRSRASATALPGASCGMCSQIAGCPAWADHGAAPQAAPVKGPRYVGRVAQLTPTSALTWGECPRKWRARHVLGLPGWPMSDRGRLGMSVHAALARLHEDGPCSDDLGRRTAAATEDGVLDCNILAHLDRHADRCPRNAESAGHECSLAELLTDGRHAVMLTARIDALWEHNGILDCRDYKTGLPQVDRVADHVGAQIQALVLAPVAASMGLRLRLRYEHLAEGDYEDPEIWEPDEDELEAARSRMLSIAAEMAASEFRGIEDPDECRRCPYWRACPDSAADQADDVMITFLEPEEREAW